MGKEVHGSWVSVTGTAGEVATILDAEKVTVHQIAGIGYDGTNVVVLYSKGQVT